jgi:universal stress protein E
LHDYGVLRYGVQKETLSGELNAMAESRRVLVIVDPTSDAQPAVDRAVWLAERTGDTVELFICDYDQHLAGERFHVSASFEAAQQSLIDTNLRYLRELTRSIEARNVALSIDARWDHPLAEGIIRKVQEFRPDLVVKDTHYHSAIKRSVFSNTDWELIQNCPVNLLLVKPRSLSDTPNVVAAVDPVHEHDKPAELDRRILAHGEELCLATNGTFHIFHAFDRAPAVAAAVATTVAPISTRIHDLTEALETRHRQALSDLLSANPPETYELHVHQGSPNKLLPALAMQLKADFVVMGAVSRGDSKHAFVGSTAERVLDHLPCDLLIVKPAQ